MSSKRSSRPRATSNLARTLGALFLAVGALAALRAAPSPLAADVLTPIGGLPPNLVGQMRSPSAFVQTSDGKYIVFDQRGQQVYGVDAAKKVLKKLVAIGPSDGEILNPTGFAYSANKTFTIVDQPAKYERVQTFYEDGTPLSRYQRWPSPNGALRVNGNGGLFGGLTAIAALGRNLVTAAQASSDSLTDLMHEIDADGNVVRRIGSVRATGQDADPGLRRALNAGIPVVAPDGSVYFVFTTGVPMFRKYSAAGELLFERHIEGPELDVIIQSLPTVWSTAKGQMPVVTSTVTTAAMDPAGRLWISLGGPFTYVYDASGDKIRTVQFRGTELMTPTHFFFTSDGRVLVTPGCYEFLAPK
jgi:hypothetical protein